MDLPRGSPVVGSDGRGTASEHAGPGQGWGGMGPRCLTHSSMPRLMLGCSTTSFPAVTISAGITIYGGGDTGDKAGKVLGLQTLPAGQDRSPPSCPWQREPSASWVACCGTSSGGHWERWEWGGDTGTQFLRGSAPCPRHGKSLRGESSLPPAALPLLGVRKPGLGGFGGPPSAGGCPTGPPAPGPT